VPNNATESCKEMTAFLIRPPFSTQACGKRNRRTAKPHAWVCSGSGKRCGSASVRSQRGDRVEAREPRPEGRAPVHAPSGNPSCVGRASWRRNRSNNRGLFNSY